MNQFLIQGAIVTGIAGFLGSLTAIGMAFANLVNARAQQVVTHTGLVPLS